jgi:hypothetical protein
LILPANLQIDLSKLKPPPPRPEDDASIQPASQPSRKGGRS